MLRGLVTDENNTPIAGAKVQVDKDNANGRKLISSVMGFMYQIQKRERTTRFPECGRSKHAACATV
jgi:protocatechuate 3,4-dioxygenase beta subunit